MRSPSCDASTAAPTASNVSVPDLPAEGGQTFNVAASTPRDATPQAITTASSHSKPCMVYCGDCNYFTDVVMVGDWTAVIVFSVHSTGCAIIHSI